ncbi:g7299 [Coccomyxa elongata]
MIQGSQCIVVSRDKAPRYLKKDYVLGSYLVGGTRSEAAKRTLFSCTNETLNAWTTIISLVLVNVQYLRSRCGVTIRWDTLRWDAPASNGFVVFDLFYLSGTLHAPFSLCCSLWVGISLKERDFWRQLDVFFIFTASVFRGAAIGWPVLSTATYKLYIVALLADYAFCITSTMILRQIKDIPRRQIVFGVGGMCAGHALPMLVACVAELQRGTVGRSIALSFGVVLCLGLSALICTKNVPEKWKPGSAFDILHSHALMHVLVYLEYYFEWLFICHHMYSTTAADGDQ